MRRGKAAQSLVWGLAPGELRAASAACVASREEAHPQQGVRKGLGSGDDIEACVVAEPCQQLAAAPTVTGPAMLCLKGR